MIFSQQKQTPNRTVPFVRNRLENEKKGGGNGKK